MIILEQFRVIKNQSVRVTFGLEIRAEIFHLEGDMITSHDSVFATWPMKSFCPKTLKIRIQHTPESWHSESLKWGRPNDWSGFWSFGIILATLRLLYTNVWFSGTLASNRVVEIGHCQRLSVVVKLLVCFLYVDQKIRSKNVKKNVKKYFLFYI